MVSSSKILTVSYGTFSCTLEGFDESFDTMKAIAEYFRDLAQDDRYFGAEPPTPDAEMLARIAEREIARRVEARMENGQYVLRPSLSGPAAAQSAPDRAAADQSAPVPAAAPAPAPAQSKAPAAEVAPAPQPASAAVPAPQDDAETETPQATIAPTAAETDAPAKAESPAKTDAPAQAEAAAGSRVPVQAAVAAAEGAASETRADPMALALAAQRAMAEAAEAEARLADAEDNSVEAEAWEDFEDALPEVIDPAQSAPVAPASDPNSMAAKLQRIRDVVSASGTPAAAYSEDQHADFFLSETDSADAAPTGLPAAAPVSDEADPEETVFDAPVSEEPFADDAIAEAALEDNLFADTISAFVASQDDTPAETEDDTPAPVLSDGEQIAEDNSAEAFDDALSDAEAEDDAEDVMSEAEDESAEEARDAAAEDDEAEDMQAATPAAGPRARVLKVKRADFEAAVASGRLEEVAEDEVAPRSSLSDEEEADLARELAEVEAELDDAWDDEDDWDDADDAEEAAGAEFEDAPAAETAPAPRSNTGLRLRRDAPPVTEPLRRAPAPVLTQPEDDLEEDVEDVRDEASILTAARDAASQDNLTDEDWDDEDDLDRAFDDEDEDDEASGSHERDDVDEAIEAMAREGARKAVKMSSPARVMLTENRIEEDDTSVSRILDETNTQLEEPEGNRRRSAIAHLRAAVAATRADRILSRRKDPEKETEPYRADLANAVRPRRPDAAEAEPRSERPQVKPAPLKLVAEQRVDAAEAVQQAAPAPVRPRRVIRSEEPEAGAKGEPDAGFVEFAESMGATELPELLEAAAAYMSFVEGRDQFSRPQLMTKVRQAELSESSREDRLRSFGQLLREGKIEKTHGGRFTASDRISFKPGKRAAG